MKRVLVLAVLLAALVAVPAQAQTFAPGDEVSYSASGGSRVGYVLARAGGRDLYLVSRNGQEGQQYTLPGSRLTRRSSSPDPQLQALTFRVTALEADVGTLGGAVDKLEGDLADLTDPG